MLWSCLSRAGIVSKRLNGSSSFSIEATFGLSYTVLKVSLSIFKSIDTSFWNFARNSGLGKFCHGTSIVASIFKLNWTGVGEPQCGKLATVVGRTNLTDLATMKCRERWPTLVFDICGLHCSCMRVTSRRSVCEYWYFTSVYFVQCERGFNDIYRTNGQTDRLENVMKRFTTRFFWYYERLQQWTAG